MNATAALHAYALLVSGDELSETSERCLVDEFGFDASSITRLPSAELPKGFVAGAAGGVAPLIVLSLIHI